ncbi:hypothetical protein FVE85_1867 [Porphyridium purpureum]|uniref:Uncharacterized protein n=1 Tax=Porphyridium purpureum TaxID=35688 RepID=A0A5J4YXX7_PORPP|nr:hypothetical protein FVE85_1867 [Porphyridium purpureum]|eukprot:POR0131..scf209_3
MLILEHSDAEAGVRYARDRFARLRIPDLRLLIATTVVGICLSVWFQFRHDEPRVDVPPAFEAVLETEKRGQVDASRFQIRITTTPVTTSGAVAHVGSARVTQSTESSVAMINPGSSRKDGAHAEQNSFAKDAAGPLDVVPESEPVKTHDDHLGASSIPAMKANAGLLGELKTKPGRSEGVQNHESSAGAILRDRVHSGTRSSDASRFVDVGYSRIVSRAEETPAVWSTYDTQNFEMYEMCAEFDTILDARCSAQQLVMELGRLKGQIEGMQPPELALRRRQLACMYWQLEHAYRAKVPSAWLSAKLEAMLLQLTFLYWKVYSDHQRRKAWIYHFHISKAVGTRFCRLAALNGCAAPGLRNANPDNGVDGQNCFARGLNDGTHWDLLRVSKPLSSRMLASMSRLERTRTCKARRKFMNRTGLTYEANENWAGLPLNDSTCSQDALSFLVIREPVERTVSMLSNSIPVFLRTGECIRSDRVNLSDDRLDPECVLENKYFATDNYQVRMLGGFRAALRPLGGVTSEDLEQAKRVARTVDELFIVNGGEPEYFASAAAHLSLGLGYSVYRDFELSTSEERRARPILGFNEKHYDLLRQRANEEYKLWHYARQLWTLDHFLMYKTERVCENETNSPFFNSWTCARLRMHPDPIGKNIERQSRMWRPASCGCGYVGLIDDEERRECFRDIVERLDSRLSP